MKKKILIVGAGPVGLSAAWFISQVPNIQVQIVQKRQKQDRQIFSKALNINSRTMELFQNTEIQKDLLKNSFVINKFKISTKEKLILQNDIQKILKHKTKYPSMHIHPQTLTQRCIQKNLNKKGIFVKRQTQVLDVKNISNALTSAVRVKTIDKNQKIQEEQFDIVLAADGAHSPIRKMFALKFQGQTLSTDIYLCDVQLQGEQLYHMQTIIDGQNFLLMIPMSPKLVRIMGNSPKYLQFIPKKYKIGAKNWRSQFVINNRMIQKMNVENVYFAGDAAHVHAPLGNRGMNMGIQDVYVFSKLLAKNQLSNYNKQRYSKVSNFVQKVNRLSKKALTYQSTMTKRFLPILGPILNQFIKKDILLFITGLDYDLDELNKVYPKL